MTSISNMTGTLGDEMPYTLSLKNKDKNVRR